MFVFTPLDNIIKQNWSRFHFKLEYNIIISKRRRIGFILLTEIKYQIDLIIKYRITRLIILLDLVLRGGVLFYFILLKNEMK